VLPANREDGAEIDRYPHHLGYLMFFSDDSLNRIIVAVNVLISTASTVVAPRVALAGWRGAGAATA
jgi:hypothetical protein